jgi:hypothetical protein
MSVIIAIRRQYQGFRITIDFLLGLGRDDRLLTGLLLIALMTEAEKTSETSVYFNDSTRRHIPEGCHENYKFHQHLTVDVIPPWRVALDEATGG